jgi:hypothetical protein
LVSTDIEIDARSSMDDEAWQPHSGDGGCLSICEEGLHWDMPEGRRSYSALTVGSPRAMC